MHSPDEHDHHGDLDDREDPELQGGPAHSSVDLMVCQFCSKSCSELADVCPHCHNFIGAEPRLLRKAWWIVLAVVLALLAVLLWIIPLHLSAL